MVPRLAPQSPRLPRCRRRELIPSASDAFSHTATPCDSLVADAVVCGLVQSSRAQASSSGLVLVWSRDGLDDPGLRSILGY